MNKMTFSIPNISCGHCVNTIVMELGDLEGVRKVTADQELKTATVEFEEPASESSIKSLLAEINYPVEG